MILVKNTIKRKLEMIILLTAAAVLLLSFVLFTANGVTSTQDETKSRLNTLATVLGANSSAAITYRDKEVMTEILTTLESQEDVLWAGILINNEIVSEYKSANFKVENIEETSLFGRISVEKPIIFDNVHIANFHIIGDMSRAKSVLVKQVLLGVGIFFVSMLLAFFLSNRLQRIISEPIQNLLETMKYVASHRDYSRRTEKISNDELGVLIDGFNLMLDEVQGYDDKLTVYSQELESLVVERTQELEKAKDEAEAANKIKSNFIATMSHEIRTPMNGVVGYNSLLMKTDLNVTQQEYVHNISNSSDHLLSIINDILDFSKIESGELILEKKEFNLDAILHDLQTLFESSAKQKGIHLEVIVDQDVCTTLCGDALRLSQILINLVSNAIKFTAKGTVTVMVKDNARFNKRPGIKITVSDTGIGITDDKRELLFKPFLQADNTITRRFGGTGLGLAITHRLVSLMGGEISLSSSLGKGSSFSVLIDFETVKSEVVSNQATNYTSPLNQLDVNESFPKALLNLKVLVVDDNAINLKVATTLLSCEGLDVIAANNGAEALEKVEENVFSIILMDLEMPDMSGIEVTKIIRQSENYAAEIPIIALTAHAFSEIRMHAIEAGMNDLLAKPYKPEQLFSMIIKWCSSDENQNLNSNENIDVNELKIYNREHALEILGNNEKMANELLQDFMHEIPSIESNMATALLADDFESLYKVVHKLSGSSSSVGAMILLAKCQQLQHILKENTFDKKDINSKVSVLLADIDSFKFYFAKHNC